VTSYPRAEELLARWGVKRPASSAPLSSWLRTAAIAAAPIPAPLPAAARAPDTAILGDILDMAFVSKQQSTSGVPEVHLVFRSDVFGGMQMHLKKTDVGLVARVLVDSSHTRRMLMPHIDDLTRNLTDRGFAVVAVTVDVDDVD
jgi:hypothetical protein